MINKINIAPYTDSALTLINEVPIVSFKYQGTDELKLGYVTNEVEPPFTDKSKSKFEQGNCIALLIKSVQELSKKVEALENEKALFN